MSRSRILLVDDDAEFAASVKERLEETGRFEVHTVSEGRRSVDAARRLSPDLILLNTLIPDIDGSVVAAAIRMDPALARTPMAFLTPVVSEGDVSRVGREVAGVPLIPKPLESGTLVEYVDQVLKLPSTGAIENE